MMMWYNVTTAMTKDVIQHMSLTMNHNRQVQRRLFLELNTRCPKSTQNTALYSNFDSVI